MKTNYKSLFFEVFSAGFESAIVGKDIYSSYEEWYESVIAQVTKDGKMD